MKLLDLMDKAFNMCQYDLIEHYFYCLDQSERDPIAIVVKKLLEITKGPLEYLDTFTCAMRIPEIAPGKWL